MAAPRIQRYTKHKLHLKHKLIFMSTATCSSACSSNYRAPN